MIFSILFMCLIFYPIFSAQSVIITYSFQPFDICIKAPILWKYIKLFYILSYIFTSLIIYNSLYSNYIKPIVNKLIKPPNLKNNLPDGLYLYIGNNSTTDEKVFISEKGLYQNILITGTIGTGKTTSAMYPFTKQLIKYNADDNFKKLGMLILDVKGNYYKQVKTYAKEYDRLDDLIIIDLSQNIKYNPLDKPKLKASVLAHRLKTILTLFSVNNSDSYWLDKAEQVLAECIKICRLYNNGYVTFVELHKLITSQEYYFSKLSDLRAVFQSGTMSKEDIYNLNSAIEFYENEFTQLDSRVLSILRSEVTRITNTFISDYNILNTFCPERKDLTFYGFDEVIQNGKIVVLNMNIAEYKNLAKIMAAYLKLDFQAEILLQLTQNAQDIRTTCFICDEYHEYVTSTDSDFFAQSREAKCINIVATQSYTSLLNTLKDQYSVKVIIQNLINKLWFRTDDIFTIEDAQKQVGKEDKTKISKTISENAQKTNFNYFTNSLISTNSSLSENISTYVHSDFIYDTNFFTQQLQIFTCLSFLSDGDKILKPDKINLIPYFLESSKNSPSKNKII